MSGPDAAPAQMPEELIEYEMEIVVHENRIYRFTAASDEEAHTRAERIFHNRGSGGAGVIHVENVRVWNNWHIERALSAGDGAGEEAENG